MSDDLARLFVPYSRRDPCEPDTEVIATADRIIRSTRTASPSPWAGSVQWVRWTEEAADREIDAVVAYFKASRGRFVWSVGPTSEPRSLGRRLLARGFVPETAARMLAARLPITGMRTNPSIVVREADDEATMRESLRIEHATRRKPLDDATADAMLSERMTYLRCPERLRHFAVACLDGVAISVARWRYVLDQDRVHLSGAETLPEYRNRGAYSTLVAYRTERALARGCRYATIFADETTSAPILLKRGFVDVGRVDYFVSPDLASSS